MSKTLHVWALVGLVRSQICLLEETSIICTPICGHCSLGSSELSHSHLRIVSGKVIFDKLCQNRNFLKSCTCFQFIIPEKPKVTQRNMGGFVFPFIFFFPEKSTSQAAPDASSAGLKKNVTGKKGEKGRELKNERRGGRKSKSGTGGRAWHRKRDWLVSRCSCCCEDKF